MTVLTESTLLAGSERLLAERRLPQAIDSFQQAAISGADADRCAAGLWTAYMLTGDFEQAWRQSDAIRRRGSPDPHRFWNGESLAGKRVILRSLHGFGDATQFLRYAPRLRALTSHLVLEVPPRFQNLARYFDGVKEVVTWEDSSSSPVPPWDVQIEVMELPYIFRTQPGDLPIAISYLHPPVSSRVRADRSESLRVGLAWSAGSWNPSRAISLEALRPILDIPGCEFWNLQGGPEAEASSVSPGSPMHEADECRDTIEGLASTISQLHLVISVDTLAAHLGGALGVDTWLLLQHEADWRWMHDRTDSPWYPSISIFRQPSVGDWGGVIAKVRGALQARVRDGGA